MQSWLLLAALAISAAAPAAPPGTNGAGEKRNWTVADSSPVEAEFVSVASGTVVLSHTEQVDVAVVRAQRPKGPQAACRRRCRARCRWARCRPRTAAGSRSGTRASRH